MQYMLLIYEDETMWQTLSQQEADALLEEYGPYTTDMRERGELVYAAPLEESPTAKTVRVRNGEHVVTDGPFAETKEQLGGFYIVDVETFDEALAWAARVPTARYGTVEVRPVRSMEPPQ